MLPCQLWPQLPCSFWYNAARIPRYIRGCIERRSDRVWSSPGQTIDWSVLRWLDSTKIEHSEMWHHTSHWSCRHFQTYCFILDFARCFCLVIFTITWHLCRCLSFRVRPPCQLHNSRSQQCEWNLLWKPALETLKAKAKWEKSRMISGSEEIEVKSL